MPDADVSATPAHALVEGDPCGPLVMIVVAGVGFKVLEGTPVLHEQEAALDVAQETALGMFFELLEHAGHGEKYRQPFMDFPEFVDSHADDEDNEVALEFSGHSCGNDISHGTTSRLKNDSWDLYHIPANSYKREFQRALPVVMS